MKRPASGSVERSRSDEAGVRRITLAGSPPPAKGARASAPGGRKGPKASGSAVALQEEKLVAVSRWFYLPDDAAEISEATFDSYTTLIEVAAYGEGPEHPFLGTYVIDPQTAEAGPSSRATWTVYGHVVAASSPALTNILRPYFWTPQLEAKKQLRLLTLHLCGKDGREGRSLCKAVFQEVPVADILHVRQLRVWRDYPPYKWAGGRLRSMWMEYSGINLDAPGHKPGVFRPLRDSAKPGKPLPALLRKEDERGPGALGHGGGASVLPPLRDGDEEEELLATTRKLDEAAGASARGPAERGRHWRSVTRMGVILLPVSPGLSRRPRDLLALRTKNFGSAKTTSARSSWRLRTRRREVEQHLGPIHRAKTCP
jgi:hypothetical protein